MTNQEAQHFTSVVFDLIKKAKTIKDIESVYKHEKLSPKILNKNQMDDNSYPKIQFSIDQNDIQVLKATNILDSDLNFKKDITSKLTDPLAKILYATAWKNGDLKKVKHIIKGVLDSDKQVSDQNQVLVFYQFGKYLTKTNGQPIIDQHVIRAFAIYHDKDSSQIERWRKLEIINKNHIPIINEYKKWLASDISQELQREEDYTYHIDKLLFATGKTIKLRKSGK